jgi:hypothetical protein
MERCRQEEATGARVLILEKAGEILRPDPGDGRRRDQCSHPP